MSIQPFAPPREDIDLLDELDFDPDLPCEVPPPLHYGDTPAAYLVENVHPCSGGDRALFCRPCWQHITGPGGGLYCLHCGARPAHATDWFHIVCEVRP